MFHEECNCKTMLTYPFFLKKLQDVQKAARLRKKTTEYECDECRSHKCYQTGNIIWSSNIQHRITDHQLYPSTYFTKAIMGIQLIDNYIINPPLILEQVNLFDYIPLHYNKLLIIDALLKEGSFPRYENENKFIYSEHSGVISIKNKVVENIIISAETDRIDIFDNNIYLPINADMLSDYEYIFHTHPNATSYAGRIKEGIIYEFPSSSDILNFVKYHDTGIAQASLIVAPEGSYLIRPLKITKTYDLKPDFYDELRRYILKLEKMAVKKLGKLVDLSDPNTFHEYVSNDLRYIKLYNEYLDPYNLFIEYYPRHKKNGEWCLRQINLPYIDRQLK